MRTVAALLLLSSLPAHAQQPPHAFMFGNWVGGLYPVGSTQVEQACHAGPNLVVRGDNVRRIPLVGAPEDRVVATVRPVQGGVDMTFAPVDGAAGFGCESPDVLHVHRNGPDEITFPGCASYPEPLVKCR